MKLAIVGAGAMGCLFAFFFAKSGKDVWLIDKHPETIKKIRENGLEIEGISGKHSIDINITDNTKEIGGVDLVLFCVKAYDTQKAASDTKHLISSHTMVLTLQNGFGNIETLAKVIGKERILGGTTSHGSTVLGPGHIRHAGSGETKCGELSGKITPRLEKILYFFNESGIAASSTRNVEGLIWNKLLINVGINALSAVTRLPNGMLIEFPEIRKILQLAVEEGLAIVKRKNINLTSEMSINKVEDVCRKTAENLSSMLQDILNQKKTEVDFINGAIVKEGKALGMPMPVNFLLLNLVKGLEQTHNLRKG